MTINFVFKFWFFKLHVRRIVFILLEFSLKRQFGKKFSTKFFLWLTRLRSSLWNPQYFSNQSKETLPHRLFLQHQIKHPTAARDRHRTNGQFHALFGSLCAWDVSIYRRSRMRDSCIIPTANKSLVYARRYNNKTLRFSR